MKLFKGILLVIVAATICGIAILGFRIFTIDENWIKNVLAASLALPILFVLLILYVIHKKRQKLELFSLCFAIITIVFYAVLIIQPDLIWQLWNYLTVIFIVFTGYGLNRILNSNSHSLIKAFAILLPTALLSTLFLLKIESAIFITLSFLSLTFSTIYCIIILLREKN